MWKAGVFIGYLVLALAIPTAWALARVWRRVQGPRAVDCPATGSAATIQLDACFAVRRHALGESELAVKDCSLWPDRASCGRECLAELEER